MTNTRFNRYISALHVNGMNGRLLRMPAKNNKKRQIFLLYGHHASLERMYGLAEVLNHHGMVTMPDLPGFGGMDSFYKIGQKPTLDAYADYLASLIKLYYKRRRVTIVAMSFSVPLIIRTLQKYPELAKKVDMVVSIAGFARYDDFIFSRKMKFGLSMIAYALSFRSAAWIMKHVFLTKPVIRVAYLMAGNRHSKMKDAIDRAERDRRIDFEVGLWKMNDVRTRGSTMNLMFNIDVCTAQIKVPAYHVSTSEDRYFDHATVEQHLRIVFDKLEIVPSTMGAHAPTIVATAKEAEPYIPKRLRIVLG